LRNLLDGGDKPIQDSTQIFSLVRHIEPTKDHPRAFWIIWDPDKKCWPWAAGLFESKDRDSP
jgi:hypothetical protein